MLLFIMAIMQYTKFEYWVCGRWSTSITIFYWCFTNVYLIKLFFDYTQPSSEGIFFCLGFLSIIVYVIL